MWQQWINLALGILVIAVPFLNLSASGLTWTLTISGLIIAGLALWGAHETATEREHGRMVRRAH